MNKWSLSQLGELVQISKGKFRSTSRTPLEAGARYLGATDLEGQASEVYAPIDNAVLCHSDDVLMLWDGERSGLVGCGLSGIAGSTVARLRPDSTKVEASYLYHHLRSRFAEIQSLRTGTGIPHVPRDLHSIIEIPVPPLDEQRRIAEMLDAIDSAIRASERVVSKLDATSEALLRIALSNPETCHVVRLGDECRILGGKRLPAGHSYSEQQTKHRYLRVVDFYRRNVDYGDLVSLNVSTFDTLKRYEIRSGELFISIAGSIGYVGVNDPPAGVRTILTENAARIVPNDSFVPTYLALQMNSPAVARQVNALKGVGSGVPKLALHRIAEIRISRPEIDSQQEIARRHELIATVREATIQRISKLDDIRLGLAGDLLSGRVRTVAA